MNILTFIIAIASIFFGYRIYISRKQGKSFASIRPLVISFFILVALLWLINIYVGFIQK